MIALNIFHTFFCFYCWLWACTCLLSFQFFKKYYERLKICLGDKVFKNRPIKICVRMPFTDLPIQSNLSIADMLYNGHLVMADTFLRNRSNHGQTLVEKPLYSGYFYSGHFFWAPREYFGQNLPLNCGHYLISWEKRKHMHVFIHTLLYFNMKLFFTYATTLASA